MSDLAVPVVPQCRFCNETPYLVAPMVTQGLTPGFTLTMVVKASYRLVPGQPLAPLPTQIPFRGDEWIGDDFQGALHHGTDIVAWKPQTDLVFRAVCHPPAGEPVTACEAGFAVGDWHKVVRVVGDRTWKVGLFGRTPGEPHPFTSMPLDWEHAYGGPGYEDNPAGKGYRADLLPNVENPAAPLRSYGERIQPVGFLPCNRMWKQRMKKMGTADGTYLKKRFPLPPEDFDWTYFNEAPNDQQLKHPLRGDEELRFQNVHPAAAAWSVRLPGNCIRCFIADTDEKGSARVRELEMRCDTLFANVEEGYLHLLWRGFLPIRSENRAEVTTVYVVEEPIAGVNKSSAEHAEDLRTAKDQGQKLEAEVKSKFAEVTSKVAGVLKRYGLAMPVMQTGGKPGPSSEQLASYPFNPNGPLPAELAHMQPQLDEAARLRTEAMDQLRPLGKAHGVGIDAAPESPPTDLMAQFQKALEEQVALLKANGQPVPDAVAQQLAEVSRPGGDPFGIAKVAAAFKSAGMDLSLQSNPLVAAVGQGGTAGLLSAAAAIPSASPNMPVPGATKALVIPELPKQTPMAGKAADQSEFTVATGPVLPPVPPRPAGAKNNEEMHAFIISGGKCAGKNLYGADFTGLDLSGHDFTGAILSHACFRGARLVGATFANCLLREADLVDADLTGAKLRFSDYQQADFSYAHLREADLSEVAFVETRFHGADLTAATLHKVMATGSDFTAANFRQVAVTGGGVWHETRLDRALGGGSNWDQILFSACSLVDADFSHATITDTVLMTCNAQRLRLAGCMLKGLRAFNGTDLQGAIMVGSRMRDTSWMYVRLDEADFSGGDLRQANFMFSSGIKTRFVGADLKGAVLRHARLMAADLERANLCRATFGRADLTLANLQRSNCYETDFQDAVVIQARFQEANLIKTNLPRD